MARARGADALLNLALAGAGLAVLALLYGLAARTFVPRAAPVEAGALGMVDGDRIQLEVLNGAGVAGLAASATRFLRGPGLEFDVVAQGNAPDDAPETLVLDRVGDPARAGRVATALGLPDDRVRPDVDPARLVDVSVVLGADYADLRPFAADTLSP